MTHNNSKDPLHGMTLEALLHALVAQYGWDGLAQRVKINCFKSDPSIKSSLKFLRRTPWARQEVEALYIASLKAPAADAQDADGSDPWAQAKSRSRSQ